MYAYVCRWMRVRVERERQRDRKRETAHPKR
jgi:hypothetical protein